METLSSRILCTKFFEIIYKGKWDLLSLFLFWFANFFSFFACLAWRGLMVVGSMLMQPSMAPIRAPPLLVSLSFLENKEPKNIIVMWDIEYMHKNVLFLTVILVCLSLSLSLSLSISYFNVFQAKFHIFNVIINKIWSSLKKNHFMYREFKCIVITLVCILYVRRSLWIWQHLPCRIWSEHGGREWCTV